MWCVRPDGVKMQKNGDIGSPGVPVPLSSLRRFQDECGICGRLVRWMAVTAAPIPKRPCLVPWSLGCRRFPLPSGQLLCPAAPVEGNGAAAPGIGGESIAFARWSASSGAMRLPVLSSAIVLPSQSNEVLPKERPKGPLAIFWSGRHRTGRRQPLLERKCFHGSTIGKRAAPVNPSGGHACSELATAARQPGRSAAETVGGITFSAVTRAEKGFATRKEKDSVTMVLDGACPSAGAGKPGKKVWCRRPERPRKGGTLRH